LFAKNTAMMTDHMTDQRLTLKHSGEGTSMSDINQTSSDRTTNQFPARHFARSIAAFSQLTGDRH
jgi:hypothetical protein